MLSKDGKLITSGEKVKIWKGVFVAYFKIIY
jgi:hypothetical protein